MFVSNTTRKETVKDFLNKQFTLIAAEITKLTKHQAVISTEELTDQLVKKHTVSLLKLERQSTTIDEKDARKARTVWQFGGNYKLLGLVDSTGKALDVPANHSFVTNEMIANAPLLNNQTDLAAVKGDIAALNSIVSTHLRSVNEEVENYNRDLQTKIHQLIIQRKGELNQIKAAEDFLNS